MKYRFAVKQLSARVLLCCALPMFSAGWLAAQAPAAPAPAPVPVAAKATLTVHITGFRNAKGKVNLALFRDGKGFPSDVASAVESQRLEIDPQTLSATAVFSGLPQGGYAIAILHDIMKTSAEKWISTLREFRRKATASQTTRTQRRVLPLPSRQSSH